MCSKYSGKVRHSISLALWKHRVNLATIAKLSIRKLGSSSVHYYISTDEDSSLWSIESFVIINLRGIFKKLNYIVLYLPCELTVPGTF